MPQLTSALRRTLARTSRLLIPLFCSLIAMDAATVVYLGSAAADATTLAGVRLAAAFYGLDVLTIRPDDNAQEMLKKLRDPEAIALVLDSGTLTALDKSHLVMDAIKRHPLPALIDGWQQADNPDALLSWSAGAIQGVKHFDAARLRPTYQVANLPDFAHQLSGSQLLAPAAAGAYLQITNGAETLMQASTASGQFPIFVRVAKSGKELFFAVQRPPALVPATSDPYRQNALFSTLAPVMMFLRHAAGDRAWHTPGNYANLTVDDVWLREPYGNFDYAGLLREMDSHNFHTTMAFIPWNYDRSQPGVVALFAAHPERLSICIHGNNHIHQEFGPLATHPLSKQVVNLRQAVARMEKFSELTHIPYDRVMVFPHSVAPAATLAELKRANYLATANSLNVPSDADPSTDIDVALHTTTLRYSNFPSMRRYSAETDIPLSQLAIDSFLGNPTLFYVHEGFFADGIQSFDKTADAVNRIDPATEWRGLGYIAEHSYLERKRLDGSSEINLQTSAATIHNPLSRPVLYSIQKEEDFSSPILVRADGRQISFERVGDTLRFQLAVEGGQSKSLRIEYGTPLNFATIEIGKKSTSVAAVRYISDFRDVILSKSALGRKFIRSYSDESQQWLRVAEITISAAVLGLLFFSFRRRKGIA